MDFGSRANSNFSSNIVPESGSTDFVEGLVRLEAETAADDFRTGISAPGSGEFEVELASAPPGDGGVGGEVGFAEDG